jgi:hypothetical protein
MLPTDNSPLEHAQTTRDMVNRIHRAINALEHDIALLESRMESAYPGADLNKHRLDHERIHEREQEFKMLFRSIKEKSIVGVFLAVGAFVFAAVVAFTINYVKSGGK